MIEPLQTAVILIVFNRPESTRQVLRAIGKVRPRKLLLVADGPRPSRPGEDLLCSKVRSAIGEIDWPCEVLTNFSDLNLGCQERVISGLNWAFEEVEEAIILEDDCLPHETFFPFCQELLERYRSDTRAGMISGNNFVAASRTIDDSYYFSRHGSIWGWATWRSRWQRYDRHLQNWEAIKRDKVLDEIFSRQADVDYWTRIFESMHNGTGPSTWDYQWLYTRLIENMLSIAPNVNLVQNIGFGPAATHTTVAVCDFGELRTCPITFPLKHPTHMVPMRSLDDIHQKICFVPTATKRAKRKFRSLCGRLKQVSSRPAPVTCGG